MATACLFAAYGLKLKAGLVSAIWFSMCFFHFIFTPRRAAPPDIRPFGTVPMVFFGLTGDWKFQKQLFSLLQPWNLLLESLCSLML
jgi:hypothetical protein